MSAGMGSETLEAVSGDRAGRDDNTGTGSSPPDVSVVVVSYNTRELLRACLRSIAERGARRVAYEVIVVDNASRDGSAEMVAREFPQVRLIRNRDNVGFAAASNQGARASCGRYVLLLNSDTEVLDGALDRLVAFADAHPEAGVVGCAHLTPDGRVANSFARGYYFPQPSRSDRVERLVRGWVSGACMMLRRSACEAVGWLHEAFFFGCEDVEICWRMNKSGWQVYHVPQARIIHHGGASSRAHPQVLLDNLANRRAMVRMHAHPWVYRLWVPVAWMEESAQRLRLRLTNRRVAGM